MIVVDSSALIAIVFAEPEKQSFLDIITGGEWTAFLGLGVGAYLAAAQ